MDELIQTRSSTWETLRNKCELLGNRKLPTWFMNSHKEFSKVLQGVYKKARVIIVDFAGQDCASDLVQKQLHDYVMLFVCEEFSVALASNGKLEHLILTGGRTSPDFYFMLLQTIRLDISRRPLKVTLLNCSMKYAASNLSSVGGTGIKEISQCTSSTISFRRKTQKCEYPNSHFDFYQTKICITRCFQCSESCSSHTRMPRLNG